MRLKAQNGATRILLGVLGFGIVLLVWELLSLQLDPIRLPAPTAVAAAFVPILFHSGPIASQIGSGSGGILEHLVVSMVRLIAGVGLGAMGGVVIGLLMALDARFGAFLDAPTRILRSVPPFAILPFLLVWFGTDEIAQLLLIAFYIFLLVLANTLNAITNLSPVYARFAATLGATRRQQFRDVVLPAILPELVGGLRVALAFSWGLLVVAELTGGGIGIGHILSLLQPLLRTADLMAVSLWIVVFAVALDYLFVATERRLLRWHEGASGVT